MNKFLLGITLTAIGAVALSSCTNELNEPGKMQPGLATGLRLAKDPQVTAWSGNQNLGNPVVGTRDILDVEIPTEGNLTWTYDETDHENEEWEAYFDFPKTVEELTKKYPDAVDITGNADKNNKEVYYIPADFKGNLDANLSNGAKLFNYGEPSALTGNFNGPTTIYNAGTFIYDQSSGSNNILINTGTLRIQHYANIQNIFNKSNLILDGIPQYDYNRGIWPPPIIGYETPSLPSQLNIFSSENSEVSLPYGVGNFESKVDIHGTLYINGDVKFQNDLTQYICALIVEGLLDMTAGKVHTSYIKAETISFDGAHIWLMPESYVTANTVKVPNSDSQIYSEANSFAFIKTKDIFFGNKNNFDDTYGPGIYFAVTGKIEINEITSGQNGQNDDVTNTYESLEEFLASENGQRMAGRFAPPENTGHSKCGGNWTVEEGIIDGDFEIEDPCPNRDPQNPDNSGCNHDGDDHDQFGVCEDEECQINPASPCAPCPNKGKDNGKECVHSNGSHDEDGTCRVCGINEGCNKIYGNTEQPGGGSGEQQGGGTQTTPGVSSQHQNEVEVNLAVNDEHKDKNGKGINDLVAKLSIHVRHAGDVEIFIPVSAEFYCDNDDLVILKDHSAGNFVHGGTPETKDGKITSRSVTYPIAGQEVTLTVVYEEDGIRITTSGINEEVIKYLQEEFGDGINFEVMLYFNDSDEFNGEDLFDALNDATIKFLGDNLPDEFINAFGKEENKDCTVKIVDDQKDVYEYVGEGPHLNGSDKNKIYKKKKVTEGGE